MNGTVLIDAIVRQTTVLIAQLATGVGGRATLAHTANQIFASLVRELKEQGLSNKGIADMFGLTLRTYHNKVSRLAESSSDRGRSVWEALFSYIQDKGPVTRLQVMTRFSADDDVLVRGVLRELVDGALVFRTGRGDESVYRAARPDEIPQSERVDDLERLASLLWVAIKRFGPVTREGLVELVPGETRSVDLALGRLLGDGRVKERVEEGEARYVADEVVLPITNPAGWEAAVFDHFQAVVTTIASKLRVRRSGDLPPHWIGGSTFSYEVWRGHPDFDDVVDFLRATRERALELRARVESRDLSEPARGPLRVVLYVGQTILGIEDEESF